MNRLITSKEAARSPKRSFDKATRGLDGPSKAAVLREIALSYVHGISFYPKISAKYIEEWNTFDKQSLRSTNVQ